MTEIDELKARVAKLELMVGVKFADRPPTDDDLIPENEIPGSGYYPWLLGDYQLRTKAINPFFNGGGWWDLMLRRISALEMKQPANTTGDPNLPFVLSSPEGVSILFEADTDFSAPQRKDDNGNPTRYKHIAGIGLSEDGGFRRFQNILWPGHGQKAYIPDPTRLAVVMGFDRLGNESLTYYYAGAEFEPGKFEVKEFNKGQQMVFVRGDNGKDMSIFLPQPGATLRKELCSTKVNEVTLNEPI